MDTTLGPLTHGVISLERVKRADSQPLCGEIDALKCGRNAWTKGKKVGEVEGDSDD